MPRRPDSLPTRALALLYSPVAQRPLLAVLVAIESEIGASLSPGREHQVAHLRLAFWREECARCFAGRPAHPLTRELTEVCRARGARPPAGLAGLVDAAVWDLAAATFQTRREVTAYCDRWTGGMIAPLLERARPGTDPAVTCALGGALRELELLSDIEREARAGRVRLPLDELARAGTQPEDLARAEWAQPLAQALRARHGQLRAQLAEAVRCLGADGQPALRGLMVWAALAAAQSRRIEQRLPHAPRERDHRSALDGWRAWRAARRADAGHLGGAVFE